MLTDIRGQERCGQSLPADQREGSRRITVMKEIRLSTEYFDLEALLERTVNFLEEQVSSEVDPTYGIVWVQNIGDVPVFSAESGWDVLSAVTKEGKMVFFPFACADQEGFLDCADGSTYRPESDEKDSEDDMFIGMEDRIGFLVQVKAGTVIINPAIHAGGACPGPESSIDLCPDCGVLEEPMEKFIRSFVKG
jgi:hypothetical protein